MLAAAIVAAIVATVVLIVLPDESEAQGCWATSFVEAEQRGLISGDPYYYCNGYASPLEIGHAVMTAVVELDKRLEAASMDVTTQEASYWCPHGYMQSGPRDTNYVLVQQTNSGHYARAVVFADGWVPFVYEEPVPYVAGVYKSPYADRITNSLWCFHEDQS